MAIKKSRHTSSSLVTDSGGIESIHQQRVDFQSPDFDARLSHLLRSLLDSFQEVHRKKLVAVLGNGVNITTGPVQMMELEKFSQSCPANNAVFSCAIAPSGLASFVVLSNDYAFAIIPALFGGANGSYTKIIGKDYSPSELRMLSLVAKAAVEDVASTWRLCDSSTEMTTRYIGYKSSSRNFGANCFDRFIVFQYEVEMETTTASFHLLLPMAAFSATNYYLTAIDHSRSVRKSDLSELVTEVEARPEEVALFLRNEHPQVIAAVLSQLNSSQAETILRAMPSTLIEEIIIRMVSLDSVPKESIAIVLQTLLESTIPSLGTPFAMHGFFQLVELFRCMPVEARKARLKVLRQRDEDLATEIERHLGDESIFLVRNPPKL